MPLVPPSGSPAARVPRFTPMTIEAITPVAVDAVAVDLRIPHGHESRFTYEAGQYVTLRAPIPPVVAERDDPVGQRHVDVRRSYSLVAAPAWSRRTGLLRIASREVSRGRMSVWLNRAARPGDTVGVAAPMGELTVPEGLSEDAHLGFIVAGSGVTPVMSIVTSGLTEFPHRRFTLISGSRDRESSMFRPELLRLADAYAWRFSLIEAFSREPGDVEMLSGRLDRARIARLLDTLRDTGVQTWLTAGPGDLVADAGAALSDAGVSPDALRTEVFDDGG